MTSVPGKKWVIISRRMDYTLLAVLVAAVMLEQWLGPEPEPHWYRNAKIGVAAALVPLAIFCFLRVRRLTKEPLTVQVSEGHRARCKNCRYALGNLTVNRCPECGQAFDPADPSTFCPARWSPTRKQLLLLVGVLSFLFFVAINVLYLSDSAPPPPSLMIRIAVSVACLQTMFAVCVFEVFMRWRHRHPHG